MKKKKTLKKVNKSDVLSPNCKIWEDAFKDKERREKELGIKCNKEK